MQLNDYGLKLTLIYKSKKEDRKYNFSLRDKNNWTEVLPSGGPMLACISYCGERIISGLVIANNIGYTHQISSIPDGIKERVTLANINTGYYEGFTVGEFFINMLEAIDLAAQTRKRPVVITSYTNKLRAQIESYGIELT